MFYLSLVPVGRPQDKEDHICNSKGIAKALIKKYQNEHKNEKFLVFLKEKDLDKSKIVKE